MTDVVLLDTLGHRTVLTVGVPTPRILVTLAAVQGEFQRTPDTDADGRPVYVLSDVRARWGRQPRRAA